ncbi:MAG TPA: M15 family metallopeptidase [Rectinemataceae bacterium]|nr:M15 family metallopeptidase [Rectinemataceae bacterium]
MNEPSSGRKGLRRPTGPAFVLVAILASALLPSCARASATAAAAPSGAAGASTAGSDRPSPAQAAADPRFAVALEALDRAASDMGAAEAASIRSRIEASPKAFLSGLDTVLAERSIDPGRFARVDKVAPPLGADFVPGDLVSLDGLIRTARKGLALRRGAAEALATMVKAAKEDGVELVAGSTYRSWEYQKGVFAREVKTYGEAVARSESAEAGRSQHQLGTALDFSPIDDIFATTAAFRWLSAKAGAYGFSRSYPEGMESITGYRPESWHWRWLGSAAVSLTDSYFDGVQQYFIEFIDKFK